MKMRRLALLSLIAVTLIQFATDAISQEYRVAMTEPMDRLFNELNDKRQKADPKELAKEPLNKATIASCNLNRALTNTSGEVGAFRDALISAMEKYRKASQAILLIVNYDIFNEVIDPRMWVWALPSNIDIVTIKTRGDVLRLIAKMAEDSADAIAKLKSGEGGEEEFALAIRNSSDIMRLIAAFYTLRFT